MNKLDSMLLDLSINDLVNHIQESEDKIENLNDKYLRLKGRYKRIKHELTISENHYERMKDIYIEQTKRLEELEVSFQELTIEYLKLKGVL